MQVFHGKIITCDANNTIAQYLVEKEGRIAFVGDNLPTQYEIIPPIELGDNVVVPAFVDAHNHYSAFSILHMLFPVQDADSNAKIMEQLSVYARDIRESVVVGFGASDFGVEEGHLILKEQLDSICPNKPMCVIEYDTRAAVVNSIFVELLRAKASNLRGFNEATGEMSQEAFQAVMEIVTKGYSTRRVIEDMTHTADFIASRGIGMMESCNGMGFVREYDFDMEKSMAKGMDNGIKMKVAYQTADLSKIQKKELDRVAYYNLDGAFGNLDAALISNYETVDNKGISYLGDEDLLTFCKAANRAGYQIALHAVGDAAFNQAANAIATALEDYPRYDHRHIIVHGSLPTQNGLEICAKYDIMISFVPSLTAYPMNVYSYLEEILGVERASRINPYKSCLDKKVKICFCSAAPASIPDPIEWIHQACNHVNPEESISVYDALRMCTYYGALACFEEKERGSLEIGKTCDLAVLSDDPYEVQTDKLNTINVSALYLRGKIYERSRVGAMTTMLRGMFPQ